MSQRCVLFIAVLALAACEVQEGPDVAGVAATQALVAQECGDVIPCASSVTIPIALFGPISNPVLPQRFMPAGSSVGVYGVPAGSTITRIAARVRDNSAGQFGPSTLVLAVTNQVDAGLIGLHVSPQSDGSGAFQTLTVNVNIPVADLATIEAGVFYAQGVNTAPGVVSAMSVTYAPPAQ